jgi:hypothetical protein
MTLSWEIQRRRHITRSRALFQAWAIVSNDDITVQYLTRKLNHHKPLPYSVQRQYALFQG